METRAFEYVLASLSGILLAISFTRFGQPAFAWIALTPLLFGLPPAAADIQERTNVMRAGFNLRFGM